MTKRPEKTFHGSVSATSSSFGGGTGQLDITGPIEGTQLAYRLTGEVQDEDYWRNFGKERSTFIAPSLTWFGDNATVTMLYSHRDYKTPFDRGTIFDLTTKQPVNVDRKYVLTNRLILQMVSPIWRNSTQNIISIASGQRALITATAGINTAIIRRVLPHMMQRQER